jgi:hypothetical protein
MNQNNPRESLRMNDGSPAYTIKEKVRAILQKFIFEKLDCHFLAIF